LVTRVSDQTSRYAGRASAGDRAPVNGVKSFVRAGAALIGSVMLATLTGCAVTNGNGSPAPTVTGPAGSALTLLASIPIKGKAPITGYSRAQFGAAWTDTDHNGCDQRNDILRRDLTNETLKPKTHGCVVLSGTLVDRYTGLTISFRKSSASEVQIDHVVPLENAWVTGADRWTKAKRTALATDPLNLLAVGGSVNESKGSGDAATWLPRKAYRCDYVARQVAVKAKYGAWMTSAEHQAIADVLATCPNERLPVAQPIPLGDGSSTAVNSAGATSSGTTSSSSTSSGTTSGRATVSAGAFCSPEGANGVSKAGTRLVCSSKNGDRPRWRSP
jgi:hypothetical protein